MASPRLLLCTDMDRTIIPNGVQPEHPLARKCFSQFCANPEVSLVYVTGRHQKLVKEAIKHYALPIPDYAITDVGSRIYHIDDEGAWLPFLAWDDEIDRDWHQVNHGQLKAMFADIIELKLQEISKQNTHKLSYYVSLYVDKQCLLNEMQVRLKERGVLASLIWSIDEAKGIGLLDVLPQNATKLHAIEFLRDHLGYRMDEMVFAGDSGNDLAVMESAIPSVLVANATDEIKEEAWMLANKYGHLDQLYLANGQDYNMNGNYTAGVMEGVFHFAKHFQQQLMAGGFHRES